MKYTWIAIFILSAINIIFAQEKEAPFGFYVKPGINFFSDNTFSRNTNQTSEFEWGAGMTVLPTNNRDMMFTLEYTQYNSTGRLKDDNSKIELDLSSIRFGFLNTLPIHEKVNFRFLVGVSLNNSDISSDGIIGYYTGIGFERKLNKGFYYFTDLQYDLVNYESSSFSGNVGGTKIFFGLKYFARK